MKRHRGVVDKPVAIGCIPGFSSPSAFDQGLHGFAYRLFNKNLNKNEKYDPTTLKMKINWSI